MFFGPWLEGALVATGCSGTWGRGVHRLVVLSLTFKTHASAVRLLVLERARHGVWMADGFLTVRRTFGCGLAFGIDPTHMAIRASIYHI